jgi:8-hydroxy-5-deazaflavin:NADPH oxidoreductase
MTTAMIGTGGLGSAIPRELASGGETLRLSSADKASARTLAAQIGRAAVAAAGNRDALRGADTVVLALRFTVLKGVLDEIAGRRRLWLWWRPGRGQAVSGSRS